MAEIERRHTEPATENPTARRGMAMHHARKAWDDLLLAWEKPRWECGPEDFAAYIGRARLALDELAEANKALRGASGPSEVKCASQT